MTQPNIVTLAETKAHLRYPSGDTADDAAIQGFISAADAVLRRECGDVIPTAYSERHSGGRLSIWLRHLPVLSVDNVEEGWGYFNAELDYQQVNSPTALSIFAYSIDNADAGEISRRSAGNVPLPFIPGVNNIRVQYTAGRASIPGNVRLAELELIAHWWQNSQLRAQMNAAVTTQFDSTDQDWTRATGITSMNLGVPNRIIELLKPDRAFPIFA